MRTKTGLTAAAIRTSDLYGVAIQALEESAPFPDYAIEEHIRAAEDWYERELGIRFGRTRICCAAVERGLTPGDDYDETEAPYSFPPDFFAGDRWGFTQLRKKPVVSLDRVAFAFPHPAAIVFELNPQWLRLDQKNGCFNIIPSTGPTILLQYNSAMLSIIGGSFTLPQSIVIDYTIGFTQGELNSRYADLLRAIRLRASISMLPGLGTALNGGRTSSSLGLDGMSEGGGYISGRYGPYSGIIEGALREEKEIRDSLMQSIHGVRLVVL